MFEILSNFGNHKQEYSKDLKRYTLIEENYKLEYEQFNASVSSTYKIINLI